MTTLEDNAHSDVVFRLALGWPETLSGRRWRGKNPFKNKTLEQLGFPHGTSATVHGWNQLDRELYAFAEVSPPASLALPATLRWR